MPAHKMIGVAADLAHHKALLQVERQRNADNAARLRNALRIADKLARELSIALNGRKPTLEGNIRARKVLSEYVTHRETEDLRRVCPMPEVEVL